MVAGFNEHNEKMRTRWYESYYEVLVNKAFRLTGGSPDARDLASETVEILLAHDGSFQTVRNINRYADVTLARICAKHLKRRKTREDNSDELVTHYKSLSEEAMKNADNRNLFQLLQYLATEMLPKQSKQVFHLSFYEGMKNKDIAILLGISERTVESHKRFAYEKLKTGINRHAGGNRARFLLIILFPVFVFYLFIQKILS